MTTYPIGSTMFRAYVRERRSDGSELTAKVFLPVKLMGAYTEMTDLGCQLVADWLDINGNKQILISINHELGIYNHRLVSASEPSEVRTAVLEMMNNWDDGRFDR